MYAVSYSVTPGPNGGLGHHARQVLDACAAALPSIVAFGPPPQRLPASGVTVTAPPQLVADWRRRFTWRRYFHGAMQLEADRLFGAWLAGQASCGFQGCYVFTQIALELLRELETRRTPNVLDNPNGHIRDFYEAVQREASRWLHTPYPGHPTLGMVERVEEEYARAAHIRVASSWARTSMASHGVDPARITVVPHSVDSSHFRPAPDRKSTSDALRVLFVGSLSLGKGFPYLLSACRALNTRRISVRVVGATGDPWCRRLFNSLAAGLDVTVAPGDPLQAYQEADILVLPTLHDGFGLVVAEAMACGLPVITTDKCGASGWLDESTGWVIPAGELDPLTAALEQALQARQRLAAMGELARREVVARGAASAAGLADLIRERIGQQVHAGAMNS
jgi:glycosyltransferase involved in cell wall biosynthesis